MSRRHETGYERRLGVEQAARKRAERARPSSSLSRGAELARVAGIAGCAYFVAAFVFGIGPVTASFATWGFVIAGVLKGRLMQARAQDATALMAADPRPPILYLRPFGMDRLRVKRSWASRIPIKLRGDNRDRYEEWLARRMCAIGPFVTLGDPSEGLPRLGAARLYAHDAIWPAAVEDLMARAGTVIVHVGDSPGLAWEIERVVNLGEPERVLLSMPLGGALRRQRRYAAFRARFDDVFPRGLPDGARGTHFLYFDADWTPHRFGELGALPPFAPPAPGAQRAQVLRKLAPEFKRMWAPRWVRVLVYLVLATLVLDGLYEPGYLVLAALGLLVIRLASTPDESPITITAAGTGGARPHVAPTATNSVPPPVARRSATGAQAAMRGRASSSNTAI